jgi:hypothetical protein
MARCKRGTTTKNVTQANSLFTVANLETVLALATDDDWSAGLVWYQTAHAEACKLSHAYGVTVRQAAGIIAALSPQTSWEENLRIADLLCAERANVHTADAQRKALAILDGADPITVLGGRKVRSFYANILAPFHAGPVTIDRHAAAILAGITTPEWNTAHEKVLERKHYYRIATGIYRHAARQYGILPQQIQAIAWLVQSNRSTALLTF